MPPTITGYRDNDIKPVIFLH